MGVELFINETHAVKNVCVQYLYDWQDNCFYVEMKRTEELEGEFEGESR